MFLAATIVSFSQQVDSKIHYSSTIKSNLCLELTIFSEIYDSKYVPSYLISERGDTIYPINKNSLDFIVCPQDFGVLSFYEKDIYIDFIQINPLDYKVLANTDLKSIQKPCNSSNLLGDELEIDILSNDQLFYFSDICSIDSGLVEVEIIEAEFKNRTRFENGKLYFKPRYVDGVDSEEFHYKLNHDIIKSSENALVRISYESKPSIKVSVDIKGESAVAKVINGTSPYSFSWNNLISSENVFSDLLEGENIVIVEDSEGCVDSLEFKHIKQFEFSYPEILTPNGDGVNDEWYLSALSNYSNYQVSIFDRKGVLLYHSKNEYQPWCGTYNGREMPSSDYWFVINFHDFDREIVGHFTLIR